MIIKVIESIKSVEAQVTNTFKLCTDLSTHQQQFSKSINEKINTQTNTEIETLQSQNTRLHALLFTEKSKSKLMQERFKRTFLDMLGEFDKQSDDTFKTVEMFGDESLDKMIRSVERFKDDVLGDYEEMKGRFDEQSMSIIEKSGSVLEGIKDLSKV